MYYDYANIAVVRELMPVKHVTNLTKILSPPVASYVGLFNLRRKKEYDTVS